MTIDQGMAVIVQYLSLTYSIKKKKSSIFSSENSK